MNVHTVAALPTRFRTRSFSGFLPFFLLTAACSGGGDDPNGVGGVGNTGGNGGMNPNVGGNLQGVGGDLTGAGGNSVGDGGGLMGDGGAYVGVGGNTMGAGGVFLGVGGSELGVGGSGEPATCMGDLPAPALDGAEHNVTVDGNDSWGDLPHFWNTYGTGHLGLYLREERGWGETLKEHTLDGVQNLGLTSVRQHGLFHDDIGIYREENGVPKYDFSRSDLIFDFFVSNGIKPIVELAPMPRDLALDPSKTVFDWNMIVSQPKDYNLWQELVFKFVEHSVERYSAEVVQEWYFEVWNEPECCQNKFWAGTLQEYHELYDHAAAGVRRALPNGRVGGPVPSQPRELTTGSAAGQLFLEHVTTDNYVTPGSPGILDFFSYHSWDFVGGAVDGYFLGLDLLDSFNLTDTQIAITEFGPTWQFDLMEEPQEMSQGAAFVAQTYSDISQRAAKENRRFPITYSWWVLSDVFEEGVYHDDDPFIGGMGLTTRENIRTPAYNAYSFLAKMGHEQIALAVEGTGDVGGMAARDADGGVQIILYNGQNPGIGPSGMGGTEEKYYNISEPHEIEISVSGLTPDLPFDVTTYRVDDAVGNAYATWQGQGRPHMSDMSDADWQALRDTMVSPPESIARSVCGETFTHSLSLPSPGVFFVTLTPTPPQPL